jgi:hypothetical protein
MKFTNATISICFVLLVASHMAFASVQPEALQQFELDSLRVWHVHRVGRIPIATVMDPKGYLHTIIRGNRMGRDYGVVTSITSKHVTVSEVKCIKGDWVEVNAIISVMPSGSPFPDDHLGKIDVRPRAEDCH